jgi:hypothetical protein
MNPPVIVTIFIYALNPPYTPERLRQKSREKGKNNQTGLQPIKEERSAGCGPLRAEQGWQAGSAIARRHGICSRRGWRGFCLSR